MRCQADVRPALRCVLLRAFPFLPDFLLFAAGRLASGRALRAFFRRRDLDVRQDAGVEIVVVGVADGLGVAVHDDAALVEPDDAGAELSDLRERVRNEDRGDARLHQLHHLQAALLAEGAVADGEDLVEHEDLRLHDAHDGEGHARAHAGRQVLVQGVLEVLQLGEFDDVLVLGLEEFAGIAQQRSAEINVLPDGQLPVEAGAELEQRGDALAALDAAADGRDRAGQPFSMLSGVTTTAFS